MNNYSYEQRQYDSNRQNTSQKIQTHHQQYIPSYHPANQQSILITLQQSIQKKPTFQQMFILQQQKIYLWQLLALKQEEIQKLNRKSIQSDKIMKQLNQNIRRKNQVIEVFRLNQVRYNEQLKRNREIRQNIAEELEIIRNSWNRHNQFNQKQVPTVNQAYLEKLKRQNKALHQQNKSFKQKNTQLYQNVVYLQNKNSILEQRVNEVMIELRKIKCEVIEKFNINDEISKMQQQGAHNLKENINNLNKKHNLPETNRKNKISITRQTSKDTRLKQINEKNIIIEGQQQCIDKKDRHLRKTIKQSICTNRIKRKQIQDIEQKQINNSTYKFQSRKKPLRQLSVR